MSKSILLSLLIAPLLAGNVAADAAETIQLDEVVVSATEIDISQPLGATQLDESTLPRLRSSSSDSANLLREIPGVSLYGAGGVSSLPAIHGMADDRLRIQVDGMNLISACANHMNPPLSYIDPTNVGSIQVFSGITPVSVGGDSIGGTIRVNSPEPEFAATGQGNLLKGQAGAFYRSNGNVLGGNLSSTFANEKLSMTYSGSTVESDNYTAGGAFKESGKAASDKGWLDGNEVGSSRYKSENHSLGFALRNDNHLVELKLGLQQIPYQGFPNQRMDMTDNNSEQVNLRYKGQYQWGALESRVYYEHTRHSMDFADDKQFVYGPTPPSTVVAPGMPMETEGENVGALLKADIILSERDTFRVGSEVQQYRLNDWWPPSPSSLAGMVSSPGVPATMGGMAPNTFWNINDGKRDRYDLFAEWEARWNAQWLSQVGVRSDKVKMDTGTVQGYNTGMMYGDPASPTSVPGAFNAADRQATDDNIDLTALARYTPLDTLFLEVGVGQKTRSPNLYERYAWSTNTMAMEMVNFAGDGNYYVGNLQLEPEIARTISVTVDGHDATKKKWGIKLSPYYTYIEDYIDAQRCPTSVCGNTPSNVANLTAVTGFVKLQFVNQNARIYGMDLSGFVPLIQASDYGSVTATGILNYAKGENTTTDDNLYNIMPLNAKLAVVHHLSNWTNTAEVQMVDAKTDVSQVRDEVKTAGYSIFNLRASYAWKQARFEVGVENVFNILYDLPLGGAYVGQGPTMSGSVIPWGVPVPGMGRSVYAGVTVGF